MLFNKNNDGSEELHALVGTFYASNKFSMIKAELVSAENELAHIVGPDVLQRAAKSYQDGTDSEFVDVVRMPVALLAISRWSKLLDVSHEDTGRKRKLDDNEKMPFEWMIDRDDMAMKERYFRSLDTLYRYLEENDVAEWRKSAVRRLQEESIVKTIADFEAVYPIEHSYYVFYLMQSLIVESQKLDVKKIFGDAWRMVTDNSPDEGLLYLAQRMTVLTAVIKAVKRWSIAVFPLEIARRFSPTYQGNRENRAGRKVAGVTNKSIGRAVKRVSRLALWQKNLIMMWFSACLRYLQNGTVIIDGENVNMGLLFSKDEGTGSGSLGYSWNDLLIEVSKDQTIGTMERVDEEPLFSIFSIMWHNYKESKRNEKISKAR